jgi:uncharacterized damage-inducible protein DinB
VVDDPVGWLRAQLQRSVQGGAWHGPSLRETLEQVSYAQAVARPIAGAHTIAELVHHAAAWMEEVRRRLDGSAPTMPERGDWPSMPPGSEYEWTQWLEDLEGAARALDGALSTFPAARLQEPVGIGERDAPLGSGVSYAAMLNGVIQHNVYHAGQILLLARAAR